MRKRWLVLCSLSISACAQSYSGGGGTWAGYDGSSSAEVGDSGSAGVDSVSSGADAGPQSPDSTGKKDANSADIGSPPVGSAMVSPACIDGQYQETLPDPKANIASLISQFKAAQALDFVLAVLQVRYPTGRFVLDGGNASVLPGANQGCVQQFWQPQQGKTIQDALNQASTLVHECGHALDMSQGGFSGATYVLTPEVQFTCKGLAYAGQNPGFARSLIRGDEFAASWPPCANFGDPGECDGYAPIYLSGDAKDKKFDGGDQGFDSVLEETVQYVNSLATGWVLQDQQKYSISAEDGLLTFLWYTERYLHMARTQYPSTYKYLSNDACWRRGVLTVWGRAWLYLQQSQDKPKLNLRGAKLRKLVTNPVLLDEIARLRQAEGCP